MSRVSSLFIISILFVLTNIVFVNSSFAEDRITRPFDWVVEIETKELAKQFEYTGSHLKPIVKTHIVFYATVDEADKKSYEDIWYHNGKPCGLERLGNLTIRPGDGIAIKIKHKTDSPTEGEYKAAANAILRIILDANLNHNSVAIVTLPDGSYSPIISELRNQNAVDAPPHDADHPLESVVNIFLQSGTDGPTQTLYFL